MFDTRSRTDAIVVHCTATLAGAPYNVASIRQMHKARGFSDIGYHFLIGLNGEIWEGRAPKDCVGAHVKDFNATTVGVAYVGGLRAIDGRPTDTRTKKQTESLITVLKKLTRSYTKAVILGHRDLSPDLNKDGEIKADEYMKMCPCFDAGPWAKSVGLPGGKYSYGKYKLL